MIWMVLKSSIYWNKRVQLIFKQTEMGRLNFLFDAGRDIYNAAVGTGKYIGSTLGALYNTHREAKEAAAEKAEEQAEIDDDDKARETVKQWEEWSKKVTTTNPSQLKLKDKDGVIIKGNLPPVTKEQYREAQARLKGVPYRKAQRYLNKGTNWAQKYYKANKTAFKEAGKDIFNKFLYSKLGGASFGEALGTGLLGGYETFMGTPHEETSWERVQRRQREWEDTMSKSLKSLSEKDSFNIMKEVAAQALENSANPDLSPKQRRKALKKAMKEADQKLVKAQAEKLRNWSYSPQNPSTGYIEPSTANQTSFVGAPEYIGVPQSLMYNNPDVQNLPPKSLTQLLVNKWKDKKTEKATPSTATSTATSNAPKKKRRRNYARRGGNIVSPAEVADGGNAYVQYATNGVQYR